MSDKKKSGLDQAEYALGMLNRDERPEVPGTRPDLDDRSRREDEAFYGLAALVPSVDPPEGLFAAIEAGIDALPSEPIETLLAEEGEWIKRSDKVWKKTLSSDSKTGRSMYLLRCEPGAVIPSHEHARDEYSIVIEGDLWLGDALLKAGDFQRAQPGSIHPEIRTTNGCLVLVYV